MEQKAPIIYTRDPHTGKLLSVPLSDIKVRDAYHEYYTKLCQERVERLIEDFGEDILEPIINFYVPDKKNRDRSLELYQQFKRQQLKKSEGVE